MGVSNHAFACHMAADIFVTLQLCIGDMGRCLTYALDILPVALVYQGLFTVCNDKPEVRTFMGPRLAVAEGLRPPPGAGNAFAVANQLPNNIYAIISTGLLSAVVAAMRAEVATHPA